jgi:RecA-family ATPase
MAAFVNGSNYLALPRNTQKWLVDKLIPSGGLVNLYGKPKTHKSFCALHMAAAISNPLVDKWEGFAVHLHGPVLYLQIDTPRTAWGDRMLKLVKLGSDFENVWFADMQMVPSYPFNCLDPASLKWLAEEVARLKPVLVVVDTIREAHNGDENDSTVMRNVMSQLVSCVLPIQAAMLFLSHQKKDSAFTRAGGDDLMDDARGSSYVSGRMDNIIRLTETRLTWKGRMGDGNVTVKWVKKKLAVVVDLTSIEDSEIVEQVIEAQLDIDPNVNKTAVATALCVALKWNTDTKSGDHKKAMRRLDDAGWDDG